MLKRQSRKQKSQKQTSQKQTSQKQTKTWWRIPKSLLVHSIVSHLFQRQHQRNYAPVRDAEALLPVVEAEAEFDAAAEDPEAVAATAAEVVRKLELMQDCWQLA